MPEASNKKSFNAFITYPLAKQFSKILSKNKYLTANHITLFRIIPTFSFVYYLNKGSYKPSLYNLILCVFTGCLDGTFARLNGMQSLYGHHLNHLTSNLLVTISGSYLLYNKLNLLIALLFLKNRIYKNNKVSSGIESLIFCLKNYSNNKVSSDGSTQRKSSFRPTGNFNDNLILIILLTYPMFFKIYNKENYSFNLPSLQFQ